MDPIPVVIQTNPAALAEMQAPAAPRCMHIDDIDVAAHTTFCAVIRNAMDATAALDAALPANERVPSVFALPRASAAEMAATLSPDMNLVCTRTYAATLGPAHGYTEFVTAAGHTEAKYDVPCMAQRFLDLNGCFHAVNKDAMDGGGARRFTPAAQAVMEATTGGAGATGTGDLRYYSAPKIDLCVKDLVLPVCHEGMNRSQVTQAVLSQVLGPARVADAHGVFSGFDPVPLKQYTPADFGHDEEAIAVHFASMLACRHPDLVLHTQWCVAPTPRTPYVETTGTYRRPKQGFLECAIGVGAAPSRKPFLTPTGPPLPTVGIAHAASGATAAAAAAAPAAPAAAPFTIHHTYNAPDFVSMAFGHAPYDAKVAQTVWEQRAAARDWFTAHYYRPSVLRARAPGGKVVFLAYMDAAMVVATRLVESAVAHGETLDGIYVVALRAADRVEKTRTAAERRAVVAEYASLFRVTSGHCCAHCGFDYKTAADLAAREATGCVSCARRRPCPTCTLSNALDAHTCDLCHETLPSPYLEEGRTHAPRPSTSTANVVRVSIVASPGDAAGSVTGSVGSVPA